MTVDRGGLQYTIRIEDAFSTPLAKFIKGIRASKKALESLKGAGKSFRDTAKAIRELNAAQKKQQATAKLAAQETITNSRIKSEALRRERKLTREAAVAQRQASLASREAFNNARRLASADQQRLTAAKKITKVLNDRGKAERLVAEAQARGVRLTDQERRKLGLMGDVERQIYDLKKKRAALQAAMSSAHLRQLSAETIALQRQKAAQQEADVGAILRKKGLDARGRPLIDPAEAGRATKTGKAFAGLRKRLGGLGQEANRVSFTFRRLFGILAAFAAARAVLRGFRNLVKETIRFNAAIEQATLGVAALFLAVGDVRDATGEATTSAYGLALAQAEARKQIQLLRRDALKTAATFEQLLETFQVAVAPGFQAGLDIGEIRKFTLDISRAASAIGLQQNQLAEEIRSILSGTIQARTTRIAVALGITNEDIRNAKEAGVLVDFLQEKFSAFESAGEEALKTFNALLTNLIGGFQQVLEAGGLEFFVAIKDVLKDLFDLLLNQDPITEILTPDPRAVAVVEAFTGALGRGLLIAREVAETLTFKELGAAAQALGGAIVGVAILLANIIKGAIQGIRDLAKAARLVAGTIKRILGVEVFDNDKIGETIALLTRVLTIFFGITAALGLIKLVTGSIGVVIGVISNLIKVINFSLIAMKGLWIAIQAVTAPLSLTAWAIVLAITGVVAGLVLGLKYLKDWLSEITGIELKWISFFKLIGAQVKFVFKTAINQIAKYLDLILMSLKQFFTTFIDKIVIDAQKLISKLLGVLGKVSKSARKLKEELDDIITTKEDKLDRELKAFGDDFKRTADAYNEAQAELKRELALSTVNILAGNEAEESLDEFFGRMVNTVKNVVQPLLATVFAAVIPDFDSLKDDFQLPDTITAAQSLSESFREMGGIIAQNRKGLIAQTDLLKKLKEEARKAKGELEIGVQAIGVDTSAANIRKAVLETEQRLSKERVFLEKELMEVLTRRNGVVNKLGKNEERIAKFAPEQQKALKKAEVILREITKLSSDRADVEHRLLIAQLQRRNAVQAGFGEEAAAAQIKEDAAQGELEALDKIIEEKEAQADVDFALAKVTGEQLEAIRKSVLARIVMGGELVAIDERIVNIAKDKVELERMLNVILADRLILKAAEARYESEREKELVDIELRQLVAEQLARNSLNNARKRVILADAELAARAKEIEIANTLRDTTIDSLIEDINKSITHLQKLQSQLGQAQPGTKEEADITAAIVKQQEALIEMQMERSALQDEHNSKVALEAVELAKLKQTADEALESLNRPIEFGFIEGVRDFIDQALDMFTTFREIVANSFVSLSQIISKSIVGALTGEGSNFREAFASFLKNIANQIIAMLVQVAIAKALLRLGFLGGDEVPSYSKLLSLALGGGFTKGGKIPDRSARASAIEHSPFSRAQGLAIGGVPVIQGSVPSAVNTAVKDIVALKPSSVDPRDKVPIWASPGEWVVKAKAVKLYGSDLMGRLNDMLIDPTAMRAIAGVNARGAATRTVSRGALEGGAISTGSGAPTAERGSEGSQGPSLAVVVGSEESMQQMLSGGRNALLDFMRANRDEFMGEERGKAT